MRKVTSKVYQDIKGALKKGQHPKTVSIFSELSLNTVYVIRRSKSYADYKRRILTGGNRYDTVMQDYLDMPVRKPKIAKMDKIRRQAKQPWWKRWMP